MALFEEVLKKHGGGAGLAIGIGALVAPAVVSAVGQLLRPAAKALIKGGMVLYEDARGAAGELTNEAAAAAPARADERPRRRRHDDVKAVTAARDDDMAVEANKAPARRGRPRKATTRMAKKPG
jgi:hypothetical protein